MMSETGCCELPSSENLSLCDQGYSQAEYLRVRNTLVQVLEELKLRRRTDVENEERIRHLVNEKHQLECKYDTEVSRVTSINQKHTEEVRNIHREYEDKVRQMQEEKSRHLLCKENVEKETKALKDEIRDLQLHKYNLEKQLHDQTRKLQLQVSASEKYLSQLSAIEQKFNSVAKHYHLVLGSQGRLEKNVDEAMLLNRTLTYVNQHQKCLVDQFSRDLEESKRALLSTRVQIQSQPAETSRAVKHLEQKVMELETKVKQKTEEVDVKTKELVTLDLHHQKTLQELKEAHKVVSNLMERAQKQHTDSVNMMKRVEDAEATVEEMEAEREKCHQKMEADSVAFEEASSLKDAQVHELKSCLTEMEKHLREVKEDYSTLEQLNSAWAQKNLELTGPI
ncbi:coiled-coil domain-containing protein 73-like [Liolophura sinensis]|uniref:coiled-coil domain-containing protein 73-like n=1 Tax=Liolophura sinensis TaxID=3198878 RepID=UPI00315943A6